MGAVLARPRCGCGVRAAAWACSSIVPGRGYPGCQAGGPVPVAGVSRQWRRRQCGSGHLAPGRRSRPTGHCAQPGLLPAQQPGSARTTTTTTTGRPAAQARLCLAAPPADTRRSWFIMHNLYSENIHNNLVAKKSFKSIFGFFKSNSHVSPECRGRSLREVGGRWAERDWPVGGTRARGRAWLLPRRRCAVPRGGARDSSFICGGGRRD